MKIECKLIREGGTKVELDGVEYHFAPGPDGKHVAEVTDKTHIQRFLSIGEAYQLPDDDQPAAPDQPAASDQPATTQEPEVVQETVEEDQVNKTDLVARAKALGIKATNSWGVAKLLEAIAAAEAAAGGKSEESFLD